MDEPLSDRAHQIAGVASLHEPVRRALYDYVVAQDHEVGRDEAAGALGISRPLVAFHLDKLVEEGLLETTYLRLTGRTGPGAGRPSKLYRRSRRRVEVTLPPRRYELAARLFAEAMAEERESDINDRLHEVAYRAGMRMGEEALQAAPAPTDQLTLPSSAGEALQQLGYEPYDAGDGEVRLRNCPFHELSEDYRSLVCGANLSLLRGFADGLALQDEEVALDPRPGECCVVFRPRGD